MLTWFFAVLASACLSLSGQPGPVEGAGHEHGEVCAQKAQTRYRCTICGNVYDPAHGDPDREIKPGTAFYDLPDTWNCPDCGASKADYEPVEDD